MLETSHKACVFMELSPGGLSCLGLLSGWTVNVANTDNAKAMQECLVSKKWNEFGWGRSFTAVPTALIPISRGHSQVCYMELLQKSWRGPY